jgi:nitronate monooxygenase
VIAPETTLMTRLSPAERADTFCQTFGLRLPILLGPMAGVPAPALSMAVANAGGLGSLGALLMQPAAMRDWARTVRAGSNGAFQINLWIPDPAPARDRVHEARLRDFLGQWGPPVPPEAGDARPPDFDAQCAMLLDLAPPVVSTVMGLWPDVFVRDLKARGIKWIATATAVPEALAAEAAGADAVIAQGIEAGGHRAGFDAARAGEGQAGLFALIPAIADRVSIPVIAAGGIADGRGIAAALMLGASAAQIGTGYLRTPEAGIAPAWSEAIGAATPERTMLTRACSGRLARALATAYAQAAAAPDAPEPAPYPVQRALTQAMRDQGARTNDIDRIQAWSGQSGHLASSLPAADLTRRLWDAARDLFAPGR